MGALMFGNLLLSPYVDPPDVLYKKEHYVLYVILHYVTSHYVFFLGLVVPLSR